jgi:hypothetical protein
VARAGSLRSACYGDPKARNFWEAALKKHGENATTRLSTTRLAGQELIVTLVMRKRCPVVAFWATHWPTAHRYEPELFTTTGVWLAL